MTRGTFTFHAGFLFFSFQSELPIYFFASSCSCSLYPIKSFQLTLCVPVNRVDDGSVGSSWGGMRPYEEISEAFEIYYDDLEGWCTVHTAHVVSEAFSIYSDNLEGVTSGWCT